jgi:hypothetical protein
MNNAGAANLLLASGSPLVLAMHTLTGSMRPVANLTGLIPAGGRQRCCLARLDAALPARPACLPCSVPAGPAQPSPAQPSPAQPSPAQPSPAQPSASAPSAPPLAPRAPAATATALCRHQEDPQDVRGGHAPHLPRPGGGARRRPA